MSTALQNIRKNLAGLASPVTAQPAAQATPGGATEALRQQATAATGRADTGEGALVGSGLERAQVAQAAQTTQDARAQAGRATDRVQQAQTQLEKDTQAGLDELSEQQAGQVQQYRQKAIDILTGLQRGRDKLSFAKQKAAVEQAGFIARFTSKKYVDELQMAGKRKRLDNMRNFRSAALEMAFKDKEDLLMSDLSFRRALGADQREFTKYVAGMDLNSALALATGQLQSAASAAQWSAASGVASAGAKAYAGGAFSEAPAANEASTEQPGPAVGADYAAARASETDLPEA